MRYFVPKDKYRQNFITNLYYVSDEYDNVYSVINGKKSKFAIWGLQPFLKNNNTSIREISVEELALLC